jgi:Tol biopolymer transport system component
VIGRTISQYRVEEKLGQGGMGEVYRASDSKLRRDVALKVLPDAFAADPERMARFRREAQVLASLNHPNIGAIYGLEEMDGVHALVLELIEGDTLSDRLRRGPMSTDEALPVAIQIAAALDVAHESGIVHRDLKPENIKLTADGQVKVLDFGLAKAMTGDASSIDAASASMSPTIVSPTITGAMTAANVILGTAAYMSPEQARGHTVDRRTDIWAFGVCLFEMLTGRRLFMGDTVSDTLASVLKVDPDWDSLPERTPARVHRLLRRCLERDPRNRLRDIGDARISLEETLAGEDEQHDVVVAAGRPGARYWMTTAFAVLVAAAAAFLTGREQVPSGPEPALRKFVLPLSDLSTGFSGATMTAISPDGKRIAYTSEGRLWIREMDRIDPRVIDGTEGAVRPFWSPDGEWIAYGTVNRLWKVRPGGGNPSMICELSSGFNVAAGGVWEPDGTIVFCHGDGPLLAVSSQGGDPDTLLAADPDLDDDFHCVSGLPDNRGYLFVVHRRSGHYDRIDVLSNGERREVLTHPEQQIWSVCYSPTGHLLYRREPQNRGIWAVEFSLEELRTTGKPFLAIPEGDIPHVASDGTMVHTVGAAGRTSELVLMDRDGTNRTRLGEPQNFEPRPALSPDGRRIAVEIKAEGTNIWVLDSLRGTQTRLTFEDGDEFDPYWHPDGTRIYYVSGIGSENFQIWTKLVDGTEDAVSLGRGSGPRVSQDGRILLLNFYDLETQNWDIYQLPLGEDGLAAGESKPFLVTDAIEHGGDLSPDGRYVAYHSLESGQTEIYIKTFPEGRGKWQVTIDGGFWPQWSAAGDELFFMKGPDLHVVSVETERTLSLGTPQFVFSRKADTHLQPFGWPDSYSMTGDAQRFLVIEPTESNEDRAAARGLVVTQNWFSEFRDSE